jgi:hypothetical protein
MNRNPDSFILLLALSYLLNFSARHATCVTTQTHSCSAPAVDSTGASNRRDSPEPIGDRRSGLRLGAQYIVGGSVTAERHNQPVAPLMSVFGWQFEQQYNTGVKGGPVPLMEVVGLVGGMDQGVAIPSGSWLWGLRQTNGWEAALGPTVTPAGVRLSFAGGITHRYGNFNLPMNLAVTPGRRGASISITTGFNISRPGY